MTNHQHTLSDAGGVEGIVVLADQAGGFADVIQGRGRCTIVADKAQG